MHVVMLKFVMHVVYNAKVCNACSKSVMHVVMLKSVMHVVMLKFVMHVVYNAKVCNACSNAKVCNACSI